MCRKSNPQSGLAVLEYIIIILAVIAVAFVLLAWLGPQLRSGANLAADAAMPAAETTVRQPVPTPPAAAEPAEAEKAAEVAADKPADITPPAGPASEAAQ